MSGGPLGALFRGLSKRSSRTTAVRAFGEFTADPSLECTLGEIGCRSKGAPANSAATASFPGDNAGTFVDGDNVIL